MDQTVGSGSDNLVLRISQDAYRGSAQYTIRVDGAQIGGTLTADSLRSSGQWDNITVRGDWAAGSHTVQVNFLNDAYDGTAAADRNLYLDGAAYNGATVGGAARSLLSAGPASFGFTEGTGGATGGTGTPAPAPGSGASSGTVGSGSDTLVLRISQDAYQGSAQYTVSVDGRQIGGTFAASASHAAGQSDTLTLLGDWAAGNHTVQVNFLNDAWGGSSSADRNLYVDGATYNGATVGGAARSLLSAGPASFGFTEGTGGATGGTGTPAPAPGSGASSGTVGSGSDTLVLRISQDAYQGSAQYTVSVDGRQIGGTFAASASHAAGQSDILTLLGDWAAGNHTVQVNFLNHAWGGSSSADRNLYVDGATYNGTAVGGAARSLLSAGPASFGFTEGGGSTPAPPSGGGGGGGGTQTDRPFF